MGDAVTPVGHIVSGLLLVISSLDTVVSGLLLSYGFLVYSTHTQRHTHSHTQVKQHIQLFQPTRIQNYLRKVSALELPALETSRPPSVHLSTQSSGTPSTAGASASARSAQPPELSSPGGVGVRELHSYRHTAPNTTQALAAGPQRALLLLVLVLVVLGLGGHRVVVRIAEQLFDLGVHRIAA